MSDAGQGATGDWRRPCPHERLGWCQDCWPASGREATLREQAEVAVRELYDEEGVRIWWADHDRQAPDEQERRQTRVVALADGGCL